MSDDSNYDDMYDSDYVRECHHSDDDEEDDIDDDESYSGPISYV